MTQEGLAERARYSADYIGKLERDQRELPAAALDRLSIVLGLADPERAALRAARDRSGSVRLLVGRDAEMAGIRRDVAGLGPPVLLFAAEPGMGKTRLLDEAASCAARSGWAVARGGCQRRAQDLYAPISGALTDALRRLPDHDRAQTLRQAGRLDLLLPELAPIGTESVPGDRTRTAVHPEQQRRLLFSAAESCQAFPSSLSATPRICGTAHRPRGCPGLSRRSSASVSWPCRGRRRSCSGSLPSLGK